MTNGTMSYRVPTPIQALRSPDPIIRKLAEKREKLRCEIVNIETFFRAYAETPAMPGSGTTDVALLEHANMMNDDRCNCAVCVEWRLRQNECEAAMKLVPKGHQWSICACPDCRFAGRIHLNYVAASNVRDLVIEMAFHANWHSKHGPLIMQWLENELKSPHYTVRWCAYEIGRRPVDEWLKKCEAQLSPILSGAVFMMGEGRRVALEEWQPSQLGDASASMPMWDAA